jgi:hypothetical protein
MNKYLKSDEWCIIEEGFDAKNHKLPRVFSVSGMAIWGSAPILRNV